MSNLASLLQDIISQHKLLSEYVKEKGQSVPRDATYDELIEAVSKIERKEGVSIGSITLSQPRTELKFYTNFSPLRVAISSREDLVENHFAEDTSGLSYIAGLNIDYTMTESPTRYSVGEGVSSTLDDKETFSVTKLQEDKYEIVVKTSDPDRIFAPGVTYNWCCMSEEYSK